VLKQEWQSQIANLKCQVELTENGFNYVSGFSIYKPTWPEVISVYQTKQLLMFCNDGEYVLLIPKRAFPSTKQLEQFLELAYQKTAVERNG
jgi:YcxB-like protein